MSYDNQSSPNQQLNGSSQILKNNFDWSFLNISKATWQRFKESIYSKSVKPGLEKATEMNDHDWKSLIQCW